MLDFCRETCYPCGGSGGGRGTVQSSPCRELPSAIRDHPTDDADGSSTIIKKGISSMEPEEKIRIFSSGSQKYEIEKIIRIYNSQTGEYLQIGKDEDGLGLVSIVQFSDDGRRTDSLEMTPDLAIRVANGIFEFLDNNKMSYEA